MDSIRWTALLLPALLIGCGSSEDGPPAETGRQSNAGAYGVNADLRGYPLFPPDNAWNRDISTAPVAPNSATLMARVLQLSKPGTSAYNHLHPDFGTIYGIPYVVVRGSQPKVKVTFQYASESDPGPYPIPRDAPIEGGPTSTGDRHVLVVDRDARKLYELYAAYPNSDGSWRAGSGALFDLTSNRLRPAYWTSADAAGLPILPGLVRYDEAVLAGEIRHALRFTVSKTRRAFTDPARHWASSITDPSYLPMGARLRLKASYQPDPSWPNEVKVIVRCLQRYGMILADNGSTGFITGTADPRWNNDRLRFLRRVPLDSFEVLRMDRIIDK